MNQNLENALEDNLKHQKQARKQRYTRPELFVTIEEFMIEHRLIGYGGMAINELLPLEKQFYTDIDVPDYDFVSPTAEKHSVELSNRIMKMNQEVEVKSALFEGTYKIFVNAIPIVDITQMDKEIFNNLHLSAVRHRGIFYAPYNYLRMSMYQELSRPMGDLSRWQKVYHRLNLLNEAYPLLIRSCNVSETTISQFNSKKFNELIDRVKSFVLLGDYAMYYYQSYFPKKYQTSQQHCVYVQVEKPQEVFDKLKGIEYKSVYHSNKLISFYQIYINHICMMYIICTDSCQSYNEVNGLKIASYDTILSIYYILSFMNHIQDIPIHKLLSYCFLMENIKKDNKKDNKKNNIMRRFRLPCNGTQKTYEQIRQERDKKYKIYKKTGKYRHVFFRYRPTLTKRKYKK